MLHDYCKEQARVKNHVRMFSFNVPKGLLFIFCPGTLICPSHCWVNAIRLAYQLIYILIDDNAHALCFLSYLYNVQGDMFCYLPTWFSHILWLSFDFSSNGLQQVMVRTSVEIIPSISRFHYKLLFAILLFMWTEVLWICTTLVRFTFCKSCETFNIAVFCFTSIQLTISSFQSLKFFKQVLKWKLYLLGISYLKNKSIFLSLILRHLHLRSRPGPLCHRWQWKGPLQLLSFILRSQLWTWVLLLSLQERKSVDRHRFKKMCSSGWGCTEAAWKFVLTFCNLFL